MTVAIIDYGSGNLRSAAKAFEHAANEVGFPGGVSVTADAAVLDKASHIVLPGVGAFADCKRGLEAVPGIVEALIATAMGLFAAIPAVIAYNRYADQVDRLVVRYDTFMEELIAILQRSVARRARQAEHTRGAASPPAAPDAL